MNKLLLEAAWSGDVEYLFKSHKENPSTIHNFSLQGGENPLHIACLVGHLDFVKGILKLKKVFASELNQDGLSPLHIASANGDVEIVKEILKIDSTFCQLEGRERMIPLHFAAIKGRVDVIQELLLVSADSVESKTNRGETALHLSVVNSQFRAFKVMVNHLKEFNREVLLNEKDFRGNTVLHLAVSRKQYEVVDYLMSIRNVDKHPVVEVNSLNKMSLKPLDNLLLFQSEAGDLEIYNTLTLAGATTSTQQTNTAQNETRILRNHPPSPANRLSEYFKYNNIKDSPSSVRNTLLVIVILITTATYQAVLSPPGGVWQDDLHRSNNQTMNSRPHKAGQAIMATQNKVAYGLFLMFNSIGFFTSIHMIYVLTAGFPMRLEIHVLLIALAGTYDTSMVAIIENRILSSMFIALSVALPLTIPFITRLVRGCYLIKRPRVDTSQSTTQLNV